MLDTLLPVLLFAALALAVLGAAKRFLMWRRGRPAKVDWIGGLMQMPRRYLVDLHHVVERDRYMSRTHVATAGGFVLAASACSIRDIALRRCGRTLDAFGTTLVVFGPGRAGPRRYAAPKASAQVPARPA